MTTKQTKKREVPRIVSSQLFSSFNVGIPLDDLTEEQAKHLSLRGYCHTHNLAHHVVSGTGSNPGDDDLRKEFGKKPGMVKSFLTEAEEQEEFKHLQSYFGIIPPKVVGLERLDNIKVWLSKKEFPYALMKEFQSVLHDAIVSRYPKDYTRAQGHSYGLRDSTSVQIFGTVRMDNGTMQLRDVADFPEYAEEARKILEAVTTAYHQVILDRDMPNSEFSQIAEVVA